MDAPWRKTAACRILSNTWASGRYEITTSEREMRSVTAGEM
jgi:hypothetical protein